MISSSLHASMFAYSQNVPVLAFPQDHKLRYFFEERALSDCTYDSTENLAPKLEQLLRNIPNYSQPLHLDEEIVDAHLEKMAQIVNEPIEYEVENPERFRQSEYNDLRRSFYSLVMQNLVEANTRETYINDLGHRLAIEQEKKIGLESPPLTEPPSPQRQSSLLRTFLFKLKRFDLVRNQRAAGLIHSSEFFDKEWYLVHNPDVAMSKIDPAWHYFIYGGFEGRDPGPNFSSAGYLRANPDVAAAGQNPLIHYLTYGQREGRSPKVFTISETDKVKQKGQNL